MYHTANLRLPIRSLLALAFLLSAFAMAGCTKTGENTTRQSPSPGTLAESSRDQDAGRLPSIRLPFTRIVLDNGLVLILSEDHSAPIAEVKVGYRVGPADDGAGKVGFAHLFQGFMLTPTARRPQEWHAAVAAHGGSQITETYRYDSQTFGEIVPTGALPLALWMESDRMGQLRDALTQQTLDRTRREILLSRPHDTQKAETELLDRIAAIAYPQDHPYSRQTGATDDVRKATLADARSWLDRYHGAANSVLVIAGDIDLQKTTALAKQYFGSLPSGPALEHRTAWPIKIQGQHRLSMVGAPGTLILSKIWVAPQLSSPDYAMMGLISELLQDRLIARLFRTRIATAVTVNYRAELLSSVLSVDVVYGDRERRSAVEEALEHELTLLLKEGPTEPELRRVVNQHYAQLLRSLEDVEYKGGQLMMSELVAGQPDLSVRWLDAYRAATPASVRDALVHWIGPQAGVLTVIGGEDEPSKGQPLRAVAARTESVPASSITSTTPDGPVSQSEPPTYAASPSIPVSSSQSARTDPFPGPPPVTVTPPPVLPVPQHFRLSNRLAVTLLERHVVPLLQADWIQNNGVAADSGSIPGLTSVAMEMLLQGTEHLTREEIHTREWEQGIHADVQVTGDASIVRLNGLAVDPEKMFALLSDELRHPAFRKDDFDLFKVGWTEHMSAYLDQAQFARFIGIRAAYGNDHPYALSPGGLGDFNTIRQISVEDLRAFQRKWVRPDNGELLVVGDISRSKLQDILERYFGDWHAPAEALVKTQLPPRPQQLPAGVALFNVPHATRSVVFGDHLTNPLPIEDLRAAELSIDLFGRSPYSRISDPPQRFEAYKTASDLDVQKGGTLFGIESEVATDQTVATIQWLQTQMLDARGDRPFTEEEVAKAREAWADAYLSVPATTSFLATSYEDVLASGRSDQAWSNQVHDTRSTTTRQIRNATATLLDPSQTIWVVLGDAQKLEAPLRERLGIPVRVLNLVNRE